MKTLMLILTLILGSFFLLDFDNKAVSNEVIGMKTFYLGKTWNENPSIKFRQPPGELGVTVIEEPHNIEIHFTNGKKYILFSLETKVTTYREYIKTLILLPMKKPGTFDEAVKVILDQMKVFGATDEKIKEVKERFEKSGPKERRYFPNIDVGDDKVSFSIGTPIRDPGFFVLITVHSTKGNVLNDL